MKEQKIIVEAESEDEAKCIALDVYENGGISMENVKKEEMDMFSDVFSVRFDVYSITIANKVTKTIKKVPQEFTSLDLVNYFAINIQKKLKNCIIEVDCYERDLGGHLKVCGYQIVNSDFKMVWVPYDICFHELEHPEKYKDGEEIQY